MEVDDEEEEFKRVRVTNLFYTWSWCMAAVYQHQQFGSRCHSRVLVRIHLLFVS